MKTKSKLQTFIENTIKEPWLDEDKEIAPEILEDIEENLRPLKTVFEMLENEVEKVKKIVKEKEKQRKDKRIELIDQNKKIESKLKENIENITEETVGRGEIREIDNNKSFVIDGFPNSQIIKYKSKIPLIEYSYYLAIMENSGNLFWVRPSETRITQFRWRLELPIKINNSKYEVSFFAPFTPIFGGGYSFGRIGRSSNLEITLTPSDFNYPICKIFAWFNLETLEIIGINTLSQESVNIISSNSKFSDSLKGIESWILDNQGEFSSTIIKYLLNPKYEKKLETEDVRYFLQHQSNERYELKLGKVQDKPILIFKRLGY